MTYGPGNSIGIDMAALVSMVRIDELKDLETGDGAIVSNLNFHFSRFNSLPIFAAKFT